MTSQQDLVQCFKKHGARRIAARRGKIVILIAVMLPTLCGMIGLVVDGSLLLCHSRDLQHISDSAATAAAKEKQLGGSNVDALAVANTCVHQFNMLPDATVELYSPPREGPYSSSSNYVEIVIEHEASTHFIHVLLGTNTARVTARSVAGFESSTADSAVVVLDPNPPTFDLSGVSLPVVLNLPAITGGLEILGVGTASVDGAVLVNTEWGGVDEDGQQVGEPTGLLGLSHAVSAMPVGGLTRLRARDLRVVGGVDNPNYYRAYATGDPSPLKAGKLPVPDPLASLPLPTTSTDPQNVVNVEYGGVTVVGLPLLSPPTVLRPGVYDWIHVVSGTAHFEPGIYIIRSVNPVTKLSLSIAAGQVRANGVMFYITDSESYSVETGEPDAGRDSQTPSSSNLDSLLPSVVINTGILGNQLRGLADPSSPFNKVLIYQSRGDRRPIVLVQEALIQPGVIEGTIYSKWGHVVLSGLGTYRTRFVVGTMRLIPLLNLTIQPDDLLPPANDVYLVE